MNFTHSLHLVQYVSADLYGHQQVIIQIPE